jgi:peptidoglycan/LPS O-acetylase OafA/YrhL
MRHRPRRELRFRLSSVQSHAHSSNSSDPASGRVLALDGVRGIAILVYACHNLYAGPSSTHLESVIWHVLRSGWVGVSLFFVLTAYLNTARLIAARDLDPWFRHYYIRRVVRIVPLYYGFLILWPLLARHIATYSPGEIALLPASQGWYWAFLANLRLATHQGSLGAEPTIFWSLAVAAHFYLLWPVVVARVRPGALVRLCCGLVVVAVVRRIALRSAGTDPRITEAIYTLTPARMDDLALGAFLAVSIATPDRWRQIRRWARPAAGLLTTVLAVVFVLQRGLRLDAVFFQTIGYTVVSATAAACLVLALGSREGGVPRRILELPWLRACGRWSYGIYVWHGALFYAVSRQTWFLEHPVLAGSRLLGALGVTLGLVAAGVALGALSWHLYEAPLLRLAGRVAPPVHDPAPTPPGPSRPAP